MTQEEFNKMVDDLKYMDICKKCGCSYIEGCNCSMLCLECGGIPDVKKS